MDSMRLVGLDGLLVQAVLLDGALGLRGGFAGIRGDAELLVTRHGAWVGMYAGPEGLAAVVNLAELTPA